MWRWLSKGEHLLLRLAGIASAVMALYAFWHFIVNPAAAPAPIPTPAPGPGVTACDSRAQPIAEQIAGSLGRLDCTLAEIRLCDFQESALGADQTSHDMPAHMMRISVETGDERFAVIGNGRGAQAGQTAFDNLLGNLRLALEKRNLCP